MHCKTNLYFITLLLICFINVTHADNRNLTFDHITTKQGLSHNRIFDMVKDSTGYMWIATLNGLNRYDGYNITKFKSYTIDSTSISENFIESLFIDRDNNLWIGTNNSGLNLYIPEKESFKRFYHNSNDSNSIINESIHTIKQLRNGQLIIGTNDGISLYSYRDNKFTNIKNDPNDTLSLINNEVRSIIIDNDSISWIGTNGGLCRMNTNNNTFLRYTHNPYNKNSLSNNNILCITKTCDSLVWIGTSNGLNTYNISTHKFTRYTFNPNNINSICNNYIHTLKVDSKGDLWIGTTKGITRISHPNSIDKEYHHYSYNSADPTSLNGNKVFSFYLDKDNTMWIGTINHGINKCFLGKYAFEKEKHQPYNNHSLSNNIIRSLYEDRKGNLWVGTDGGGLNFKEANQQNYIRLNDLNNDNSLFGDDRILDIYESKKGDIWVGTWGGGVSKFKATDIAKIKKGFIPTIQHFTNNPLDSTSISGNIVQEITEDSFGNLWIGTENGLNIYNPINQSFTKIRHSNDDINSLCDNRIQSGCIIEDQHLNLWIGTWNGLCYINLEHLPFRNGIKIKNAPNRSIKFNSFLNIKNDTTSLGDNRITSLLLNKNGNLWIGTFGGGLQLLDLSSDKPFLTKYTKVDGLPDETIYGIEKDDYNNIWMSTNNGLSQFNTTNERFTNYNESDHIQGLEFYWGAHLRRSDGKLLFGGTNGFTAFYPNEITRHKNNSTPIINEMSIFNIPIDFKDNNSPIHKPIEYVKEVILSYTQNVISFDYTTINFLYPEQVYFAYTLEGFEQHWNYIGNRRTAIYTNLEPGKYKFKVTQVNNENKILDDEHIKVISIIIKSPFYKTRIFQISLILFFIMLFFIAYKLKIRNIEKHKIILQEKVEERTTELTFANKLLHERNDEILSQRENLVSQRDKIRNQNQELQLHRSGLEKLVEARTLELTKAKEKAEESDRLKSAFLANMSHEIRTPLNAVVGFSSLLNDNSIENKDRERFIEQINRNSDDLLMLIDDIIDLSSIESSQMKIKIEEFELHSFLRSITDIYNARANNKEVKFIAVNNISPESIWLKSDPHRLKQIITNLINNAFKFTEKGFVEFGFKIDSQYGIFYVKDTGIGISNENQKFIFDRFRKIENNMSKLYRGNGLGLTISKRLCEMLHANLSVESEINTGSTFYIHIPKEFFINK